jgi:hypothetical protein
VPLEHQNIIDFVFKIDFDTLFEKVDLWYEGSFTFEIGGLDVCDNITTTKVIFPHWYFANTSIADMRAELIRQLNRTVEFHKYLNPYIIRMTISFK